ncbi:PH domain-containing protein [Kocuria rhizophila]|uniref:PH domain-containing protein n=1 Tax=Kocuria rhizophila TaxID=72000 RepID=UPI001E54C439|nr:PH domain-containing protein [Kocuria rhizophila]
MPRTDEPGGNREIYRAASAPWLTGFLTVLGIVVGAAGWGHTAAHHAAAVCSGLALFALAYTLYWRPRLEVHQKLVRLVNPVRTVDIPWGRIVDVRTRFAVTIATEHRAHSSFALPSAGAGAALRSGADAVNRNHPIARPGGAVRVGDLTSTASGAAAHRVRTVWQRKIDTGELDVFADERGVEPVQTRVAAGPLAAVVVLTAASVLLYAV